MMPNTIQFLASVRAICGGADTLRLLKFAFKLLDVLHIVVPTILIVLLVVDLGKNVIAGNEDAMGKNLQLFIKRTIMCCALFLVPTFVKATMGLVSNVSGKMPGHTYTYCLNIALKNDDLSAYEIKWPEINNDNKPEYSSSTNQAHATVGTVEDSSDSSSSSSSSSSGSSGSSGSSDDSGDSGSSDDSSPTTEKSTVMIGDSLAATIRDMSGSSGGAIELITSKGSLQKTLLDTSTISKVASAAKKEGCKVIITATVKHVHNDVGATNVKDAIAKLREEAKADKCKFTVVSIPPVDMRAQRMGSDYRNDAIAKMNSIIRTSGTSYCAIDSAIRRDCTAECKNSVPGVTPNLNNCSSKCYNENGIDFSSTGNSIFYKYFSRQCM